VSVPSNREVVAALTQWFASLHGVSAEAVELTDVRRHAEGWSWQTWTMTVTWPGGTAGYAVRREPEDGLLAPYDVEGQYRLHRAVVDHSDVPMADLVALETDTSVLGMPFYVMERVEGGVPAQWSGKDPQWFPTPEARRALGEDFVAVLARIHAIDTATADLGFLAPGGDLGVDCAAASAAFLDDLEEMYVASALVEVPLVREAFAWCRESMALSGRVTLVHGDYRIGNFMVRDGRVVAVFDWELSRIGDPVADLAYAGLPLFRGRSPLFSHMLERDDFLATYEKHSGHAVDPAVFDWWTVANHIQAAVPHLRAAAVYEDGTFDDLRLAAMGHQVNYVLRTLAVELGI
jgi:aminoglycoside phosphotransferase (APT) family kinase protein